MVLAKHLGFIGSDSLEQSDLKNYLKIRNLIRNAEASSLSAISDDERSRIAALACNIRPM